MTPQDLHALPAKELNRLAALGPMGWRIFYVRGRHRGNVAYLEEGPENELGNPTMRIIEEDDWSPATDMNDAKALDPDCTMTVEHSVSKEVPDARRWCVRVYGESLTEVYASTEPRARTIAAILAQRALSLTEEATDEGDGMAHRAKDSTPSGGNHPQGRSRQGSSDGDA